MANIELTEAKKSKNDEFYTQWEDIEKEVQAYLDYDSNVFRDKTILCPCDDPEWSNFTKFFALHFHEYGIKKLISTSYAPESKKTPEYYQVSLFEEEDPKFDPKKTKTHGKIFILDREDTNQDGVINIEDLRWDYLKEDGDFRSEEVQTLLKESDIVITNPPFSLFRDFLSSIIEAQKDFLIIGNMNAITYKEIFPLIKKNRVWLGPTISSGDRKFNVPIGYPLEASTCGYDSDGTPFIRVKGVRWYTNLDHGRRHQPLPLMTMEDNLKFSKHKEIKGKTSYDHYDNYDAIEVPFTDAIPSDYREVMGVPISFLDKYCPEQFEICGATESEGKGFSNGLWAGGTSQATIKGNRVYKRIFIKSREQKGSTTNENDLENV